MATLNYLEISSFPRFHGKHSLADVKSCRPIKSLTPFPHPRHVTAQAFGREGDKKPFFLFESTPRWPRKTKSQLRTPFFSPRPQKTPNLFYCRCGFSGAESASSDSYSESDSAALERELSVAIAEENYAEAAKIRDALKALGEDVKSLVLAANSRFYAAFRAGDLAAMRGQWAHTDEACCVHPGSRGISGHEDVVTSWEYVWANYDFPLEIELRDVKARVRGDFAYVTCVELVRTKGSSWGGQFVTNVFERIGDRWLISVHHASPIDL